MFCTECGAQLRVGEKFCTDCGSRTGAEPGSQAFVTQPPSDMWRAEGPDPRQPIVESSPLSANPSSTRPSQISAARNVGSNPKPDKGLLSPVLLWGGIVVLVLAAVAVIVLLLTHSSLSPYVSDAEIINSIRSKVAGDPSLSRCTVDAKSVNGVVTLTGLVNSESDKRIVARIAAQQEGVKQVNLYGLILNNSSTSGQAGPGGAVSSSRTAVAPYIFNGAYAIYAIHYGPLSIPLKVSIDEVDPARRTFKGTAAFGGTLAHLSSSQTVDFDLGEFALLPPRGLNALLRGATTPDLKLPTDFHRTGAAIFHQVGVSVPAGSFLTEEVANEQNFAWFDIRSGLMVKINGPSVAADIASDVPDVPRPSSASVDLVDTNVSR